jgi:hypothetical protein
MGAIVPHVLVLPCDSFQLLLYLSSSLRIEFKSSCGIHAHFQCGRRFICFYGERNVVVSCPRVVRGGVEETYVGQAAWARIRSTGRWSKQKNMLAFGDDAKR